MSQSFFGKLRASLKEEDRTTLRLKIALTENLNKLLADPSMYTPGRFADVALDRNVRDEALQKPKGEALMRLNRMLLSAVFSGELAPVRRLEATQINPRHAEIIATSPKAQDMAVNMFSAFWSLLLTVSTVLMVSLFSKPKPDAELKDLVYGMTPLPDEGPCPWYQKPIFWATVVLIVLVAVNIIFW